jgi:uncharacterized BrkB/YihY/UPF0761 family membrane protein
MRRILPALLIVAFFAPSTAFASGFHMPCWFEFFLIAIHYLGELTLAAIGISVLFACFYSISNPLTRWWKTASLTALFTAGCTTGAALWLGLYFGACR